MNTKKNTDDKMLHLLWQDCADNQNFACLIDFLDMHPTYSKGCGHSFPTLHRICDFVIDRRKFFGIDRRAFRVTRCAECGERLFINSISKAQLKPGVPYELTGAALQHWVVDATAERAEALLTTDCRAEQPPTDWSRYLHDTRHT
jgi:hypothetical protein